MSMMGCDDYYELPKLSSFAIANNEVIHKVIFFPCLGLQSWVYSVKRRGLSVQPCGAPV